MEKTLWVHLGNYEHTFSWGWFTTGTIMQIRWIWLIYSLSVLHRGREKKRYVENMDGKKSVGTQVYRQSCGWEKSRVAKNGKRGINLVGGGTRDSRQYSILYGFGARDGAACNHILDVHMSRVGNFIHEFWVQVDFPRFLVYRKMYLLPYYKFPNSYRIYAYF